MNDTEAFSAVPDHPLARQLAELLEPYRFLMTRCEWWQEEHRLGCSLGFFGEESLAVVVYPEWERLLLDVLVGTAPCTVDALLALLSVNFDAPFKTRVAQHDGQHAVVCLEGLFPLEYGFKNLSLLIQQALAAGVQRRGALQPFSKLPQGQEVGISA